MPDTDPLVIDTPEGIRHFHLLQLKYAMRLEMKGIRVSRVRAIFPYVKKKYGLRGKHLAVYGAFCRMHGLPE